MANETMAGPGMIDRDWDDDPAVRARQIDALMAGAPADLPPIVVFGDDAVFGIRPIRRSA
jgi:hypothetical protein